MQNRGFDYDGYGEITDLTGVVWCSRGVHEPSADLRFR